MRRLLACLPVVATLIAAAPAGAAPACTTVAPALGQTITCTYSAGGTTTIAVPRGTASVSLVVRGGGGGGGRYVMNRGAAGGDGARIAASVNAGGETSLTVEVGSGGSGGGVGAAGGGGGGFSAIYAGPSATASAVIAVAGGGGGGAAANGTGRVGGSGAADGTAAGGNGTGGGGLTGGSGGADGNGGSAGTGATYPEDYHDGAPWLSGGDGGTIESRSQGGFGGGGYGGGGAGVGSGGGAGGSYVDPSRLIGSATFTPTGGTAGAGGTISLGQAGADGTISLTFIAGTFAVTYVGAGATSGSPPVDASSPYVYGTSATVLENTGNLERTGYRFAGWAADGVLVLPGGTLTIVADTVLEAQWERVPDPTPEPSASTPARNAATTLRTARPRATAAGAVVTFTAPGPGRAVSTGARGARAGATLCRGTLQVKRAGRATVTCRLTAAGRRLRAKRALVLTITTVFTARNGARSTSSRTITLPRRR